MASPIIFSKRSEHFSIWIVLRSIQLTLATAYSSLFNREFYTYNNVSLFVKYLKISVLIFTLLHGPILFTKSVIRAVSSTRIDQLDYFFKYYINLSYFLNTLYSFFDKDGERLFLCQLRHQDELNNSHYSDNYSKLPSHKVEPERDWFSTYKNLYNFSREFRLFIKRYTNIYLLNITIFTSIYFFPEKLSSAILGCIAFQTFSDKLGTVLSILLVAILQMMDVDYTIRLLTTFYGSWNLAEDFLIPYFDRVQFTPLERKQWLNTRIGVVFGTGFCYYLAMLEVPLVSAVLYSNAIFNMGFLITKFTTEMPDNLKDMATWSITESVWDGHAKFLE
ncbi:hypothetical protein CANMA_004658 [Candida margitis]|uniref:uncharacterized protein n=1 Tax=Candida margitis TaxID=1775924 RepID=UPI0022268E83|nr:uncharacterized protein CANMA_004658 [Candida margitis]KAI5953820.1 hypothetical protein CANMA_004658 [Candida margitis]